MPKKPVGFDSSVGKIYDSQGNVASDYKSKRKELVSDLVTLLQSTVETKMSGVTFSGNVDLVGNYLYELKSYIDGLKEACNSILQNYPNNENDSSLIDLVSLCDVALEGSDRAESYLNELKMFSTDMQTIKGHIYNQLMVLHAEI